MSTSSPSRSGTGRSAKQHPSNAVVVAVAPPLCLAARENSCASALFLPDYGSLIQHAVIASQQQAYSMADFESFCAAKIQSVFRMCRERQTYQRIRCAIVAIQRVFRAYVERKKINVQREEEELQYEISCFHYYATRIQAVFRGYYSRKYVDDYYARRAYIFAVAAQSDRVLQNAIHQRLVSDAESDLAQCVKEETAYTKATQQVHFILSTVGCSGVYRRWPLVAAEKEHKSGVEVRRENTKTDSNDGVPTSGKVQALPFQTNIEDDIRRNAQKVRREAELARFGASARHAKAAASGEKENDAIHNFSRKEDGKEGTREKRGPKESKTDPNPTAVLVPDPYSRKKKNKAHPSRPSSKALTMAGKALDTKEGEGEEGREVDSEMISLDCNDDDAEGTLEKVYTSGNLRSVMEDPFEAVKTANTSNETSEQRNSRPTGGAKGEKRKASAKNVDRKKKNHFGEGCGIAPMQSSSAASVSGCHPIRKVKRGNGAGLAGVGNAVEGFSPGQLLGPHEYPTPSTVSNCSWENPDALPFQRPMIAKQNCCMKFDYSDERLCMPSPLPPSPLRFSCSNKNTKTAIHAPFNTEGGGENRIGEAATPSAPLWNTPSSFSPAHKGVAHDCLLPPLVESTYNTEPAILKKSVDRLYQQHLHQGNIFKVSQCGGRVPRLFPNRP